MQAAQSRGFYAVHSLGYVVKKKKQKKQQQGSAPVSCALCVRLLGAWCPESSVVLACTACHPKSFRLLKHLKVPEELSCKDWAMAHTMPNILTASMPSLPLSPLSARGIDESISGDACLYLASVASGLRDLVRFLLMLGPSKDVTYRLGGQFWPSRCFAKLHGDLLMLQRSGRHAQKRKMFGWV